MNMKIVASALVITAVLSGGMLYYSHHVVTENAKSEKVVKAHTNKINDKTANLSVSNLKAQYDKKYPNLDKTENKSTDNIKQGMKLAFNGSTSQADFDKNRGKVISLLGQSIGNRTLSIVKPQENFDTNSPKSISARMTSCDVSYGEYNNDVQAMPVYITVQFKTRPYDPYAGAANSDTHKTIAKQETIGYSGILDTSSHTISLQHERDTLNQNND